MQEEIAAIVRSPDVTAKLHGQLMEPVGSTPAQMRATVQADLARWQPVIRKNGITLD
jgi:tripartite-type tricarboxylate transporter receptor subunit TctC